MIVNRRNFLGSIMAAGAVSLLAPRVSQAAESSIEVLINEPIGKILPDIYSHFIEHLGGVIYDGIWVGEKSKVPNIGGIRRRFGRAPEENKARSHSLAGRLLCRSV